MVAFDVHDNLATSSVATAPSPATSGTSLVVGAGDGALFANVPFYALVGPPGQFPTKANSEIVRVTARSTDTLTITRAQEGTTARTIVVGDRISIVLTKTQLEQAESWHASDDSIILKDVTTPNTPSGEVHLFSRLRGPSSGGRRLPAFIGPSGLDSSLQPWIAANKMAFALPVGGAGTLSQVGVTATATGTLTAATVSTSSLHQMMARVDYLVTTAANNAVAGWRASANYLARGNAAKIGGFTFMCRWAPATGVATTTMRAFTGLTSATAAPTDVQPSSLTNMFGMGWDAADSQVQFMTNDGAGTATKTALGASFPVPTTDRPSPYELFMFCKPNDSQVTWQVTDLVTDAVATGTITTDMPSSTTLLSPRGYCSVGGTSSVIGYALMGMYTETDY